MLARTSIVTVVLFLAASAGLAAQEKAKPMSADAEFSALYRTFKENVGKLATIQQEYNVATEDAKKKDLEKKFEATVEQTKGLETKVAAAAEKAYREAPNKNNDQNEFLMSRVNKLVATDDTEPAARLAKLLIDNDYKHKYFNLFAGLAFFGANDFESAEKYLKLAEAEGDFNSQSQPAAMGKRTLDLIAKHGYKDLWEKEQATRATEGKAGDLPTVKLETSQGDITLQLFENQAPIAVNNFVSLIEKKFYDGTKFHRVLPGFMAQGGDPKGDGTGGPGYTIPDEYQQANHRNHFRGTLSMARTGQKDSGGSQFFLCFGPTSNLDGQYTAFGRVIDGFEVLAKLQRCQPGDPNTPDRIIKATVISKRDHKYEPKVKFPDKK
jgi:cyclophilin family peptidyl-prolyl cis-trans isomerase